MWNLTGGAFVTCATIALTSFTVKAQKQILFSDLRFYDAVLDQLFPFPTDISQGKTLLVLRYLETIAGDRQIAVETTPETDKDRVETWNLPSSAPSIWKLVGDLKNSRPNLTVEQVSAAIQVHVTHSTEVLPASSPLGRLLRSAPSIRVALSPPHTFMLDAAHYRIVSRSLMGRIDIDFPSGGNPLTSSNPVVRWMGDILRASDPASLPR